MENYIYDLLMDHIGPMRWPKGDHEYPLIINGEFVGYVITEKYGYNVTIKAYIGGNCASYIEECIDISCWEDQQLYIKSVFCHKLAESLLEMGMEVRSVSID